jgi:hypothetical protein
MRICILYNYREESDVGACWHMYNNNIGLGCSILHAKEPVEDQVLDNKTPLLDIKPLIVSLHYQYNAKCKLQSLPKITFIISMLDFVPSLDTNTAEYHLANADNTSFTMALVNRIRNGRNRRCLLSSDFLRKFARLFKRSGI